MQNTRTGMLSNAFTWVELTYSSLRVDAYAIFVVISLVIALLCAGAYQEAIRQANLSLGMAPPQEPGMMNIVDAVNQYGLAVLVAICYFSNATDKGTRREMFIDGACIAAGVLLPQLVFHATSVWALQSIVTAQNLSVNSGLISAVNVEWVIIWGISMVLIGLALVTGRFIQHAAAKSRR